MSNSGKPVLDLRLADKNALEQAYMRFIKGGGLFVPTKQEFKLGSEVILQVKLPEEAETIVVSGVVAWVTPFGAQAGKKAGVGVQFVGENADVLCKKIDTVTAGIAQATVKSDTM
jgi:type IV pilus assembly protein PilZ